MPPKGKLQNPEGAHLNEPNLRRFESTIKTLIDNYPKPIKLKAADGLRLTTITARFRDAVNTILLDKFPTTLSVAKLAEIWPTIKVIQRVGPDNEPYIQVGIAETESAGSVDAMYEDVMSHHLADLQTVTEGQLQCLAYLYQTGLFTKPTQIHKLPQSTECLKAYPAVVLQEQQDGTYILL